MKHPLALVISVMALGTFAACASVGCNSILGNEEGSARIDAGSSSILSNGDAGTLVVYGDGGSSCDTDAGHKVCFGLCVDTIQPNTGCGGECAACNEKNVTKTQCEPGVSNFVCGYDACNLGYDNCDKDRTNGCETPTSTKEHCGACDHPCAGLQPLCAPVGPNGTYACTDACPLGTQNCSDACVDVQTSKENCGACGAPCVDPAGGTASCSSGVCKIQCGPGTHACGDQCFSDNDTNHCGAKCLACPQPAGVNMVATCTNSVCGSTCQTGFSDCDGLDGCETQSLFCPVATPPPPPPTCGCGGPVPPASMHPLVFCPNYCLSY